MALKAYSVGGPTAPGQRRLHLNEFRFPHPPRVLTALQAATLVGPASSWPAALLSEYQSGPDPALAEDLALYVGAPSAENVLVTAGSDEVLRATVDAWGLRGARPVLMGVPGYTHFSHYVRLRGLELVAYAIGLGTPAADHEAALRYHAPLLSAGCLVYLCSPNNPTGDMWAPETVAALAAEFPRSLFLADEAYVEFASVDALSGEGFPAAEPALLEAFLPVAGAHHAGSWDSGGWGAPGEPGSWAGAVPAARMNRRSLVSVALACPNVLVSRTLSKAFGLAALRVGYAVGRPELVRELGVAVSPKGFSPLASPVARAALSHVGYYAAPAEVARTQARAAVAELRARGWWALDTPANFYLVYVGDAAGAAARLADCGVLARRRDELPGLAGFVRLTAGSAADGAAVLAAFSQLSPPGPPPQALYTGKGAVAAVKTLARRALAALAEAGVTVWAQGGTMLGLYRHRVRDGGVWRGGLVPWDDDVDLAYLRAADGSDPLEPHVALFAAAGLTLQRNRTDAYWQIGTNPPGTTISPVHVDVFSYSSYWCVAGHRIPPNSELSQGPGASMPPALVGCGIELRYELDDERFREEDPGSPQAHCNTSYAHAELFPLSDEYRFYDLPILMPARPEAVLRRALGENFMRVARARAGSGTAEFELQDTSPA